jgi:hypothetical protein
MGFALFNKKKKRERERDKPYSVGETGEAVHSTCCRNSTSRIN